jgi:hypothetical protein
MEREGRTMAKARLKPCPFCGAKVQDECPFVSKYRDADGCMTWEVTHYCDTGDTELGVTIHVYGTTKEQAVQRWNARAALGKAKGAGRGKQKAQKATV